MKLVSDARNWWKWNSTHVAALAAVLHAAWVALPFELKETVPDWAMPWIAGFMFVAFVVARIRDQS